MHMHMHMHGSKVRTCTCTCTWLSMGQGTHAHVYLRGYPRYAPVVVVLLGLVLGLYVAGVATLPGLAFLVAVFYLQAC